MSALEAYRSTEQASGARSDYWLEHSEGFQVSGPNGRIGVVALVLSADDGVDGLVVRTGLFRTRSVFVPVRDVGSAAPRRQRLELLVAPRAPRSRVSDFVRELFAPAAESFLPQHFRLDHTAPDLQSGRRARPVLGHQRREGST